MERFVIGLDVGGTSIQIALMTKSQKFVDFSTFPTAISHNYEEISEQLIEEIDHIMQTHSILNEQILGVGMGLPGTVNTDLQETEHLAVLHWDGFNPCRKIGEYFQAPYWIDNDANLNTLGEYHYGVQKKIPNMVLLTLGTGIGGGVIANGCLYRGMGNRASEFGHMTIMANGGRRCLCGQYGHFEAYASGSALKEYVLENLGQYQESTIARMIKEQGHYDNRYVFDAARMGDAFGLEIVNNYCEYLAIGISNIMKLFAPNLVVLSGGISKAGAILLDTLKPLVSMNLMDYRQLCPIVTSKVGEAAGAYGACVLVLEKVGVI